MFKRAFLFSLFLIFIFVSQITLAEEEATAIENETPNEEMEDDLDENEADDDLNFPLGDDDQAITQTRRSSRRGRCHPRCTGGRSCIRKCNSRCVKRNTAFDQLEAEVECNVSQTNDPCKSNFTCHGYHRRCKPVGCPPTKSEDKCYDRSSTCKIEGQMSDPCNAENLFCKGYQCRKVCAKNDCPIGSWCNKDSADDCKENSGSQMLCNVNKDGFAECR